MIEPGREYLLFDGDCGVCTWAAKLAARIDRPSRFVIEPYQSFAETDLRAFGLDHDRCSRKLRVIAARGRVYGGAFAVNYFFWQRVPWKPAVAAVYVLPPLLLVEMAGYAVVARNRQRISRWLGLTACVVRGAPRA